MNGLMYSLQYFYSAGRQLVLETLYALASSTKIIKEAMAKGNVEFLLGHVHYDKVYF